MSHTHLLNFIPLIQQKTNRNINYEVISGGKQWIGVALELVFAVRLTDFILVYW
jgi:hypothetical protein